MNQIPKPEFPRPEKRRESWLNLNGEWKFQLFPTGSEEAEKAFAADRAQYDRTIQVPFSWVCPLSGVKENTAGIGWYQREVTFDAKGRVFLCFGAVDYKADVYVNGQHAAHHMGGYTSFTADITSLLKDENTLVMATNAAFPPYEYKDGDKIVGIDAEIAAAIADKLGMKLEIEDVDFGSVLTGVAEGKYDMGMAGITVTDERKETMDFSNTYATGIQVIIVKDGSPIASLDDLWNFDEEGNPVSLKNTEIKIGVQQDTTGDIYSSSAISSWGFNDLNEDESIKTDRVVRYKTGAEAVAALKTGKVDCVIIDNEPAKSFVAANEGIHILEGENEYAVEDYAICVDKGNTELLDKINKALDELKADGTIDGIINKYIPKDGGAQ